MANHLVSLKRTSNSDDLAIDPPEDFFPHSMFLDNEDIKKLGVGSAKLGDEFPLAGLVRVTSISSDEREGGDGKQDSVTLSIVEGAVDAGGASKADRIFGGDDGGGG